MLFLEIPPLPGWQNKAKRHESCKGAREKEGDDRNGREVRIGMGKE